MGGFIAGPIAVEIYRVADRAIMTETIETSCVRCQATVCLLHLLGTAGGECRVQGTTASKWRVGLAVYLLLTGMQACMQVK